LFVTPNTRNPFFIDCWHPLVFRPWIEGAGPIRRKEQKRISFLWLDRQPIVILISVQGGQGGK
jgi:hypothetical protein